MRVCACVCSLNGRLPVRRLTQEGAKMIRIKYNIVNGMTM